MGMPSSTELTKVKVFLKYIGDRYTVSCRFEMILPIGRNTIYQNVFSL